MKRSTSVIWAGTCLLATAALVLAACGGKDKPTVDADAGADEKVTTTDDARCPGGVVVSDDDCDESQRPIVFVHGTYGSGDNIANVALLFGSNGYCQDRFVAVEYNSLGGSPAAGLDALIDEIREKTGQDQVDLMGHSQGTGHCITYLRDAGRAAKVARYVNLSGTTVVPDGVKALSLSSDNDINQAPHHSAGAEKEVTFEDEDHFGVAASANAFSEIYEYLIGEKPKYTEVQCGDEMITLEGIAESFGDNAPTTGKLELYELGDDPIKRDKPIMTLENGAKGHVGPIQVKRLTAYEFRGVDADGKTIGHLYFGAMKRSNRLMRFLSPSPVAFIANLSTGKVVLGDGHSAVVGRYIGGAFRHDLGHSLKINGNEVLTPENAGRSLITVGLFLSDQDENEKSELGAAWTAPFLVGSDVFMDASEPAWIDIEWNGEKSRIPNWPSSEGMISLMLY